MGEGFQFAPGGILMPLNTETPKTSESLGEAHFSPAIIQRTAPTQQYLPGIQSGAPVASALGAAAPTLDLSRPGELLRQARRRAREIRAEIRRMKRLERELHQLERLIDAASGKPVGIVHPLNSARRSAG